MSDIRDKISKIEEDVGALVPADKRSRLKLKLDHFMPAALILLGSMITFHFFVPVSNEISRFVNLLNILLVFFFSVRLALAFSLADSHEKFLRQHWFDALLVIPAFALIKEARLFMLLESETEERAIMGFVFGRTTTLSGQIAKLYTWGRRLVKL